MSAPRTRNVILAQLAIVAGLLALGEYVAGGAIEPMTDKLLLLSRPNPSNCLQRDAARGMRYRPNCQGQSMEGTLFHTNELGLRDEPVQEDGAVRILAIGDSCTFGWRVEQDLAYPQKLARRLEERYGPGRYRVINAGVPGYTSYQGLVYLREEGLALHPQIVIFGYDFNDQTRQGDIEEALARNAKLMPLLTLLDELSWRSALWRWVESRQAHEERDDGELRVSPEKYKRNLRALADIARERGARPMMLVFGRPQYTRHREMAWQVHREARVPIVVYGGPRFDLVHPTVEGYDELVGQVLAELDKSGYLEPGASEPPDRRG